MTIDLGNVNNGIPMGSYVGGGGEDATAYHFKGSVNTYADLTAILNPSQGDVYDVKENGKNYAWTGEEWDDLGGVVDLSGYYDKEETDELLDEKATKVDLDKKQDVLTPVGPVSISTYVKSNLNNMVYTTDGLKIYKGQTGPISSITYIDSYGSYALRAFSSPSLSGTHSGEDIMLSCGYIQMDYSFGQIINAGESNTVYGGKTCFGKMVNNEFIPILGCVSYGGNPSYSGSWFLTSSDNYTVSGGSAINFVQNGDRLSASSQDYSSSALGELVQITDTNGTITVKAQACGLLLNLNVTDSTQLARLREITTARIFVSYAWGQTESAAISVNKIGLYSPDASTGLVKNLSEIPSSWGDNLFDLSGVTAQNYLELNIGDGLSVVDGKLTVPGNVPDNMVTTDTEQTISGVKTFSAGIKGNGYINNIGLTDLIYTDVNKDPHVGNVSRTLTIHTNPIGNGRILVNDGSSNYEDLHTGNIANFIDGTSITFTNNKLSATGGGETDAYTKAETDELLGEKADKFTTSAPLIISEKSDAEYDGTIANGTISFGGGNSFTTISDVLYASSHDGDRITKYVALPLDVNTIVKAPIMDNFNNTSEYGQIQQQVLLGDFDNEGKFIPYVGILNESRVNNRYGRMKGGATISNINPNGAYGLSFTYTSPSSHNHAAYNLETATPDDAPIENQSIYIEKYISDTGELTMGLWTVGDLNGSTNNMVSTTFDGSMGTELQEACKKSKWALFFPKSKDFTLNVGDFKIYETNGHHGWDKAGLLSGITNAPYKQPLVSSTANIALLVDNSTIKVNNNGQLYAVAQESPAPSNMVTTDTEQNITGTKTFINDMFLPGIIVQDSSGGSAAKISPGSIDVSRLHVSGTGYLEADSTGVILGDTSLQQVVLRGEKVQCYDPAGNKDILHTGNAFKQVKLTQAEYDALTTKDENTMYIIVG